MDVYTIQIDKKIQIDNKYYENNKNNEDTEWGWFIPLDLQYTNKKEQIIYHLKTIDENSDIVEDIYSTIDFGPIPKYKSHIDDDLINNINKNQPIFNILNCNNIKYILFRCMHFSSIYFEYIYKYMSSLYSKTK